MGEREGERLKFSNRDIALHKFKNPKSPLIFLSVKIRIIRRIQL